MRRGRSARGGPSFLARVLLAGVLLTGFALVWLGLPLPAAARPPAAPIDPARRAAEAIEQALHRHAPDVHRCFEQALADRLDVAGDVEVEVDVGSGGKVTAARLTAKGGGTAPAGLAACVEARAKLFIIEGIEPGATVVLPFAFAGQNDQFAIKASDVPVRGPRPAKPGARPPFTVKILVDPVNTRMPQASLTLLTLAPKNRVALHRHPVSSKAFYLLSGRVRLLGPPGAAPIAVEPGAAVFVPAGHPHAIENLGQKDDAVLLQIFVAPGPEAIYRDPKDEAARAAFEVVREGAKAGDRPAVLVGPQQAPPVPVFGNVGAMRVLLDAKLTGTPNFSLAVLDLSDAALWLRHVHPGSEIAYVASGAGTITVGSEEVPFGPDTALYLPGGQPHQVKFARGSHRVIQIFAPGGPEQLLAGGVVDEREKQRQEQAR